MRRLPLYIDDPRVAVERVTGLDRDAGCTRCNLHEKAKTVCVPPEGEPGGLLIVGEAPGKNEDRIGRPFVGVSGKLLREEFAKHWTGALAIDNAVRCFPHGKPLPDQVSACRSYLARTIEEVQPKRVVACGNVAAGAILGRTVQVLKQRRSYGWLTNALSEPTTPVFVIPHPAAAGRNPFVKKWFQEDVRWACTATPEPPPYDAVYEEVENFEDAESVLRYARRNCEWVAVDCEWYGRPFDDVFRLLSVSVSTPNYRVWVWGRDALYSEAWEPLVQLLEDPSIGKTGADFRVDVVALAGRGVTVRGELSDVRLMTKVLEPEADARLVAMAEQVGWGGHKKEHETVRKKNLTDTKRRITQARKKAANDGVDLDERQVSWPELDDVEFTPELKKCLVQCGDDDHDRKYDNFQYALGPRQNLEKYNALDSCTTARLEILRRTEMSDNTHADYAWREIFQPAYRAMIRVEQWGIAANADAARLYDEYIVQKKQEQYDTLRSLADINWGVSGTTGATKEYLFKTVGLKPKIFTKSGSPSVDENALKALSGKHPAVDALLKLRHYAAQEKYASGIIPHIRADGRVHSNFHVDGTRTGRGSSSDPNIYNVTNPEKDPELGPLARNVFVAEPGNILVEGDYGQLELRVAAILSQDPVMVRTFMEDGDLHMEMARQLAGPVFGKSAKEVGEHERRICKTIVFSLMFGKGDRSLAEELQIPVNVVARARAAIFGQLVKLKAWFDATIRQCRRTGEVWTYWKGRKAHRRPIWEIADHDDKKRAHGENAAGNAPIQGSAAFFALCSLPMVVDKIDRERLPAKVVLSVYDSIKIEVREDLVHEAVGLLKETMLSHDSAGVPMKVDFKVGYAWGSMKKYADMYNVG